MGVYRKRSLLKRLLYLGFAICWWAITCPGRFGHGRVVVLCYHGITAKQKPAFEWQMSKIATRATPVAAFLKALPSRRANLPKVCITFDDAFANLLNNALPALEHYQVPAAIFPVTDNLGYPPHWKMWYGHPESTEMTMTAEQLMVVSKNPLIRIGSHTLSHPDLAKIRPDPLKAELIDSKHRLEQLIGNSIEDLALPFGSYNQEVLRMAREAGYKRIYTLDPTLANPMSEDSVMGRFSMSPDTWKIEFVLTCVGAYSWLHYVRGLRHSIRKLPGDQAIVLW